MLDALRDAGLEPCEGVLERGGEPVWLAESVEGVRFRTHAVPSSDAARARLRALRLAALDPLSHLARVPAPVPLADGALLLLEEEVAGCPLDLRDEPWEPGEVTAVIESAARGLAALHAAGLAHGRVRLRHLVRRPDGAVALTGLLDGDPGTDRDPGHDARALVRLGLTLLEDAVAGEDRDRLAFALTEMPPGADVQALAERAARACPALPVRALDRAQVVDELRRLARRRRGQGAPARRGTRARHRASTSGLRPPVLVAAVGVVGLLGAALVVAAAGGPPPASASVTTASGTTVPAAARSDGEDPADAARRLTAERAEAIATGDAALLASVTVPGSPAARVDAAAGRLAHDVDAASVRVDVHDVVVLEHREGVARVQVTAAAGVRPTADGEVREEAPVRTVVLVLHDGHTGWRVHDVLG